MIHVYSATDKRHAFPCLPSFRETWAERQLLGERRPDRSSWTSKTDLLGLHRATELEDTVAEGIKIDNPPKIRGRTGPAARQRSAS